jgi:hypothetical protein
MTQTLSLGYTQVAEEIAAYHLGFDPYLPNGCAFLARGEHRAVYVDYDTDTVYKIGLDAANRNEYQLMSDHAGTEGIPPVRLYEINDLGVTVIAMPYLPEDGTVEHAGVIWPLDGDFNEANVVAHGGILWLIDAGGM